MQNFREDDGRIARIRVILVSRNTHCHEKVIFRSGNLIFCDRRICTAIRENSSWKNRIDPVGMDVQTPRFSWQLISGQKNSMQTAYEIRVTNKSGKSVIWSSGKQATDQSTYVPYAGLPLQSAATYYWQVRVWDNKGNISVRRPGFLANGIIAAKRLKAKWIESDLLPIV